MKKIINLAAIIFLAGCATSQIDKKIEKVNIDKTLIKKYHITSDDLIKFKNFYIFSSPSANGAKIVFLDKNFNQVKTISTNLDTKKIAVDNDKIYVAGLDSNYFPEILVLDENGRVIKRVKIPRKYALIKDLYVKNKDYYVLIDVFRDGKSYIEIYKNGKLIKKMQLKNSINGNFVFKVGDDLFVIGTIKNTTQDAFIANLNKGWIRFFDLGSEESFDKYKIDNEKIILELYSTDDMGADSYYEIIIDKNGKIIKNKCKMKFAPLPMKFRT